MPRSWLIPLTRGKMATVSARDYASVAQYKWSAIYHGQTWYAVGNVRCACGYLHHTSMHRFIMNAGPGQEVDHRDGNGLNNQRSNLRSAGRRQNVRNRRHKALGCSSRYKGVCWSKACNKWCAYIADGPRRPDGRSRRRHLGVFKSERAAARAYDRAAAKSFGAFAALNFPAQ